VATGERPFENAFIAAALLGVLGQIFVVNLQESANTSIKIRRTTIPEKRHICGGKSASRVQAYLVNHTPEMHQATDEFVWSAQTLNSWHARTFLAL
jgi:hypothetical protein